MKIIASIVVGLLLPLTFVTSAQAAHMDATLVSTTCKKNGDTRAVVKIANNSSRIRKINWSRSKASDGAIFGFAVVNKQSGFQVDVPAGETVDVYVWSRLNQKTRLLHEKVTALECFN